mmetsp:Transcript_100913/g.323898  ORF Transcript_100913/g.323898 Transcript_100913/m.323898 type:complete len:263 (+) Transcript_100913:808-1596(+)
MAFRCRRLRAGSGAFGRILAGGLAQLKSAAQHLQCARHIRGDLQSLRHRPRPDDRPAQPLSGRHRSALGKGNGATEELAAHRDVQPSKEPAECRSIKRTSSLRRRLSRHCAAGEITHHSSTKQGFVRVRQPQSSSFLEWLLRVRKEPADLPSEVVQLTARSLIFALPHRVGTALLIKAGGSREDPVRIVEIVENPRPLLACARPRSCRPPQQLLQQLLTSQPPQDENRHHAPLVPTCGVLLTDNDEVGHIQDGSIVGDGEIE